MAKAGRTDTGLTVNVAAAQGKEQGSLSSTQTGSTGTNAVASSSEEAMASLKEQAKGKTVGDTVSAAFTENGQVKVYTASVNESGIGLVAVRNATAQEQGGLQRNTESLANVANETGARGIQQNVAERTEGAGKLLPNVEKVTVDTRKVTEYALNPNNTSGGANKARVFESALGYNQSNSNHLMQQIQSKLPTSKAILGTLDKYGQRFTVDIPITGPNGKTAIVRTGWIFEPDSEVPRMTTVFVK